MDKKRIFLYSMMAVAVMVVAGIVIYLLAGSVDRRAVPGTGARFAAPDNARGIRDVYLYFADGRGESLVAERRRIGDAEVPARFGRNILAALIKGPVRKELSATIPEGTVCRAFYLTDRGVAYVDFSGAVRDNHPGGSGAERFTIYSVVNTLVLNMAGVEQVKILIDGQEAETLAGHIDLRHPFAADMRLIQ
ncbi:MAG: GerMN domain-containing protein [Desulfosudaceae bacterium]